MADYDFSNLGDFTFRYLDEVNLLTQVPSDMECCYCYFDNDPLTHEYSEEIALEKLTQILTSLFPEDSSHIFSFLSVILSRNGGRKDVDKVTYREIWNRSSEALPSTIITRIYFRHEFKSQSLGAHQSLAITNIDHISQTLTTLYYDPLYNVYTELDALDIVGQHTAGIVLSELENKIRLVYNLLEYDSVSTQLISCPLGLQYHEVMVFNGLFGHDCVRDRPGNCSLWSLLMTILFIRFPTKTLAEIEQSIFYSLDDAIRGDRSALTNFIRTFSFNLSRNIFGEDLCCIFKSKDKEAINLYNTQRHKGGMWPID